MSYYRRWYAPGGTTFFTIVTYSRLCIFRHSNARRLLGNVMREVAEELPFETNAIVLLWDHLHAIWTLPEGDFDYSSRWQEIKYRFTQRWLAAGGEEAQVTSAQKRRGNRGIWQKRFWDRLVRDEDEFKALLDYVHYNPVKHGYVDRPGDWEFSSFQRWMVRGEYDRNWGSNPDGRIDFMVPEFD